MSNNTRSIKQKNQFFKQLDILYKELYFSVFRNKLMILIVQDCYSIFYIWIWNQKKIKKR